MLETKPDLMKKIQESIPIAKVAACWHGIGSDLKVDLGPNYYEKKLLDLVAINNGKIHYCSINEDKISTFNAEEVIQFMKSHWSIITTRSTSGMKKML